MSETAPSRVARLVDAVQYALGLTATIALLLTPVSVLASAGFWGVKYGLFLFGVLSFGYATWLAWPRTPADLATEGQGREETRFQEFIRRVPPAAWYPLAPADRARNWVRLYLASVTMLALSFAMEAVFGI